MKKKPLNKTPKILQHIYIITLYYLISQVSTQAKKNILSFKNPHIENRPIIIIIIIIYLGAKIPLRYYYIL